MPKPFFSIIIPAYNRASLVGETIDSFLKQTFKDFELIIVDDGSTDNTKEAIQKYLSDSRVKYIYQENKERGAARNRGAQEARGEYLNFFDSDDVALPNHLEEAYQFIMAHGIDKVRWLHGAYDMYYKGNVVHLHRKPLSGWATKNLIKGNDICIDTMFVLNHYFKTILFDEDRSMSVSEDWEFVIRASLKAPIFYQPCSTVLMRQHAGRSMNSPDIAERSKLSVLNKIFMKDNVDNSIKKYKHKAYGYGYLFVAITYFSKNDADKAKPFIKKAFSVNPIMILEPKFLEWVIRIFLFPFSNFNQRYNRILYLTYNGLCQPLGQSQVIPYIIGLSKEGYKFTVLSFEHHYEKDFGKEYKKVKAQLDNAGIKWIPITYHRYPRLFSSIYDILHGITKAILFYLREPYYIIHARSYVPAMIGLILKKIFKAKLIFDMRGMMADEKVDAGQWTRKSLNYKITKWAEQKMLKDSNAIVVLTDKIKTYIQSFTYINAPLGVIPTCVDTVRFPKRDNDQRDIIRKELGIPDRIVIVYSGSIGTWYLFDRMVEFIKEIKANEPKVYFLLLNKSEHAYAVRILKEYGLSPQDYTIKSINSDEMYKYLWSSDIGIFFYKPAFSRAATYPTKLGEYIACGLPVIGNTGVGDTEEIILENNLGSIVYSFEEKEYKRAFEMAVALTNGNDFQNRASALVRKQMSVEVGVKRYKEIYDGL